LSGKNKACFFARRGTLFYGTPGVFYCPGWGDNPGPKAGPPSQPLKLALWAVTPGFPLAPKGGGAVLYGREFADVGLTDMRQKKTFVGENPDKGGSFPPVSFRGGRVRFGSSKRANFQRIPPNKLYGPKRKGPGPQKFSNGGGTGEPPGWSSVLGGTIARKAGFRGPRLTGWGGNFEGPGGPAGEGATFGNSDLIHLLSKTLTFFPQNQPSRKRKRFFPPGSPRRFGGKRDGGIIAQIIGQSFRAVRGEASLVPEVPERVDEAKGAGLCVWRPLFFLIFVVLRLQGPKRPPQGLMSHFRFPGLFSGDKSGWAGKFPTNSMYQNTAGGRELLHRVIKLLPWGPNPNGGGASGGVR